MDSHNLQDPQNPYVARKRWPFVLAGLIGICVLALVVALCFGLDPSGDKGSSRVDEEQTASEKDIVYATSADASVVGAEGVATTTESGIPSAAAATTTESGGLGTEPEPELEPQPVEETITVCVDGMVNATLPYYSGMTAYDALCGSGVSVNSRGSQFGVYVVGINGLNEFDRGPTSGWKYSVDGIYPGTSAGNYSLYPGAYVYWFYSLG